MDWNKIKDVVYKNVYQPSVFEQTLGFFDKRKKFINPFRPSKSADSSFYQKNDVWLFHDFVSNETYDIFKCVQEYYNLSFTESIIWFGNTYGLNEKLAQEGFVIPEKKGFIRGSIDLFLNMMKDMVRHKKEDEDFNKKLEEVPVVNLVFYEDINVIRSHDKGYDIIYTEPKEHHIAYWAKRQIDVNLLKEYVYCVESVIYTDSKRTVFIDSQESPIFFFTNTAKDSGQIYRPFSCNKAYKFRNLSSCKYNLSPHPYRTKKTENFILSKGFKDAFELRIMYFNVFGKTGESSSIEKEWLEELHIQKNDRIFIIMDNDAAGIKAAEKHQRALQKLGYQAHIIQIPIGHNKDIDDMVCQYGINNTKRWIKKQIKNAYRK